MGRTFADDLAADAANVFTDLRAFGRSVTHLADGDPTRYTTLSALFVREATQTDDQRGRGLVTRAKLHVPAQTAPELTDRDAWLIGSERWETEFNDGEIGGLIQVHLLRRISRRTTSEGRTRSGR